MEGVQRGGSRWRSLRERLGFKGMGCCGPSWSFKVSDMAVRESDDEEVEEEGEDRDRAQEMEMEEETEVPDLGCMDQETPVSGMNLATALAAERHLRAAQDLEAGNVGSTSNSAPASPPARTGITATIPGTPSNLRVSLMRLLEEEGDGVEGVAGDGNRGGGGGEGADGMCCVCMGRRKGAAFIPCGHTFCRVCSRELWLNRGSCPLCNRSILEILDIF
ncbi:peroxisome biogenesis factor 10-like [Macadamia integrifolia]|uniref:peroxisome biogenesis factor 10-like n=1 Tax=Macadamia integrifolia TaxID=60698 RepID=UPI001C52ED91|nr:peroxisome biogenesis factor 10-like [Macadamia integrifolia]